MDNSIQYIIIFPKDQYHLYYQINDQKERHAKKIDDALLFFISLLSNKSKIYEIEEFAYSFVPFMIDVQTEEIHELTLDLEQEREKWYVEQRKKQTDVSTVLADKNKPKSKKEVFDNLWNKPFFIKK